MNLVLDEGHEGHEGHLHLIAYVMRGFLWFFFVSDVFDAFRLYEGGIVFT